MLDAGVIGSGMIIQACPQCLGNNVIPCQIVQYADGHLKGPPLSMWACLAKTCLHKWERESDAVRYR